MPTSVRRPAVGSCQTAVRTKRKRPAEAGRLRDNGVRQVRSARELLPERYEAARGQGHLEQPAGLIEP